MMNHHSLPFLGGTILIENHDLINEGTILDPRNPGAELGGYPLLITEA